jgi:hypothetical protein
MAIQTGIIEIDLHGLRTEQAKAKIDAAVRNASPSVYRIRLIHGYHGGTAIRDMIEEEYGYGREPKVVRMEPGANQGTTELILREY